MAKKICCHCKGEMSDEAGEDVSDGLHPECVKELYPELYDRWLELRTAA